ncbi:chromate efflux transporter [Litorivita sp. NS0012-18]|uniref:chromate efflux transporter n=1 Tax=Litorivita sp. NS0012-18 TaxID=3127655 RepID=UPI003104A3F3
MSAAAQTRAAPPTRAEAFGVFLKIGLLSFGGPAAQIALMHRILVDERAWLTEQQFLNALSFCMLLPGPEAMQLATYAGWRLHGIRGGLVAGLLFVLPGAMVIAAIAALYMHYAQMPLLGTVFLGVQAAAVAIVLEALLRVAKRALRQRAHWTIAALAFVGIFLLSLPYPLIVLAAGLYGAVFLRRNADAQMPPSSRAHSPRSGTSMARTAGTIAAGLVIWAAPLVLLAALARETILPMLGLFFSKLAVVTFGGAYAVLAYMAQDVVTGFGWLSAAEMMDGLGLAETTPGPLILVTQFVGMMAGFHAGGTAMGFAGGAVVLWATFAPCFLWIFAGAPYIEWMAAQPRLNAALQAITAAVVGVILNLSLWFALHVLFGAVTRETYGPLTLWSPDPATFSLPAAALIALAALLLLRLHLGVVWTLVTCAGAAWGVGLF